MPNGVCIESSLTQRNRRLSSSNRIRVELSWRVVVASEKSRKEGRERERERNGGHWRWLTTAADGDDYYDNTMRVGEELGKQHNHFVVCVCRRPSCALNCGVDSCALTQGETPLWCVVNHNIWLRLSLHLPQCCNTPNTGAPAHTILHLLQHNVVGVVMMMISCFKW